MMFAFDQKSVKLNVVTKNELLWLKHKSFVLLINFDYWKMDIVGVFSSNAFWKRLNIQYYVAHLAVICHPPPLLSLYIACICVKFTFSSLKKRVLG